MVPPPVSQGGGARAALRRGGERGGGGDAIWRRAGAGSRRRGSPRAPPAAPRGGRGRVPEPQRGARRGAGGRGCCGALGWVTASAQGAPQQGRNVLRARLPAPRGKRSAARRLGAIHCSMLPSPGRPAALRARPRPRRQAGAPRPARCLCPRPAAISPPAPGLELPLSGGPQAKGFASAWPALLSGGRGCAAI